MDRRKFVKTAGVAAAVGAAGCLQVPPETTDDDNDPDSTGTCFDECEDNKRRPSPTEGQDGHFTDMTGQSEVTVEVGASSTGFVFNSADIVVSSGTTVVWTWTGEGGQHNVAHADGKEAYEPGGEPPIQKEAGGSDPLFRSELVNEEGHEFSYTFDEAGMYDYVCTVHINQGMIGSVEVVGGEGEGN